MNSTNKVKYLIKTTRDEFIIELPANWKVTFASVNPASTMNQRDAHCVRVYEMPGSKLRAVFDSAIAIRDLSIPLARKQKSEVGEAKWNYDSSGGFERSEKVDTNTEFVLEPGDSVKF